MISADFQNLDKEVLWKGVMMDPYAHQQNVKIA